MKIPIPDELEEDDEKAREYLMKFRVEDIRESLDDELDLPKTENPFYFNKESLVALHVEVVNNE